MSIVYYPGYSQRVVATKFPHMEISAITNAFPMVLTTTTDHDYVQGMNVAFLIPLQYGMQQLNGKNGNILSVTSDTMTIDIDSSLFSPFSIPSPLPSAYTPPTVFSNAEGFKIPPTLPYSNQHALEGTVYNAGEP